jgi:hypothetical protein
MHVDEVQRLIDSDLPHGDYNTIGGLVVTELGRLPDPGDEVVLALPVPSDPDEGESGRTLSADRPRGRPAGAGAGRAALARRRGPAGEAGHGPGVRRGDPGERIMTGMGPLVALLIGVG